MRLNDNNELIKRLLKDLNDAIKDIRNIDNDNVSQPVLDKIFDKLEVQKECLSLYYKEKRRVSNLTSLIDASRILNSTLDLKELLQRFMEIATREMNADRSTLYLLDEATNELWSLITQGPEMVEIRLPVGKGIAGKVAATGEVINIDDPYNDTRFFPEIDRKTGYITKNILCIPMRNKNAEIIGVLQVLNKKTGAFTKIDEFYLDSLALQASVAVENARLHQEALERRRLEAELKVAYQIQKNLLPGKSPSFEGFSIAGLNIPCQEVGGDYYDYIEIESGLGIAIGDVAGKGIPASLIMANLQAALRVLAPPEKTSNSVISRINLLLKQSSLPNRFITFFYGILDETGFFRFTNAGHNPPILFRKNENIQLFTTEDLIMGAFSDVVYHERTVQINPDDIIVFYTDGITETTNHAKEQYGEKRLIELVSSNMNAEPEKLLEIITSEIAAFCENKPYDDDVTLIVLKMRRRL